MNEIILNEKEWAENVLQNPAPRKSSAKVLRIIGRYYYNQGYPKSEIPSLLMNFSLRCGISVSVLRQRGIINWVVNNLDERKLIDIAGVPVTQAEMASVKGVDGKLKQRLLFTMLCLAKYWNCVNPNNNNWVNRKNEEIFRYANIAIDFKRQGTLMNQLWVEGLISFSRSVDNINIRVEIVNCDSPEELVITDFRNLGNQYKKYCGEPYLECEICGAVVRKMSNAQKYCPSCAREVNCRKTEERRKLA